MAGLGYDLPEDALHPSHDLVTRRVGGLVQVDNTRADVGLEVTLQGRGTSRDRGEVTGANEHCAKKRVSHEPKIKDPDKDIHFS
jgi:hypothetical protein